MRNWILWDSLSLILAYGLIQWIFPAGAVEFGLLLLLMIYVASVWYRLFQADLASHVYRFTPQHRGFFGRLEESWIKRLKAQRKKTRFWLRQAKSLRKVMNDLPFALIMLDKRNRIQLVNHQAKRWFDITPADMGRPLQGRLRQPELQVIWDSIEAMVQRDILYKDMQLQVSRYRVQGLGLVLVTDKTQEHHLQQMRQDFIANASHELRTPLTVIHGYLEMLVEMDAMPTHVLPPLKTMFSQSQRMTQIISDLLTLSQLESAGFLLKPRPLALDSLIKKIQAEHAPLAEKRQQKLNLELTRGIQLDADERLLNIAISNLVTNALRYTQEGGDITIRTQSLDSDVAIEVIDNGPGIAPEHLPRLTQRFYRVDRDRSRQAGGTGLGLSIVKHMAERHGGTLKVSSELGKGSTFKLLLPKKSQYPRATGN